MKEAVDDLAVDEGTEPGPAYTEAAKRISSAESAPELKVLVEHLHDKRPTVLLEAIVGENGRPVDYTVGAALFWKLRLKFVVAPKGRLDARKQMAANPNLKSVESLTAWFSQHGYDLKSLREEHRRLSQSGA
ncbi:MAG: hypothetical protein KDB29_11160 [Planctomycetes bacterium]|nr:hypothetical protein [Planctomycetota bacterium]